ncbi:hypothetical protein O6H91_03G094100 [Diphasiastrum complanatum]|uniref:Uncharacterized protein n=1 Tax=Diphasiastrum complanatum TaxID=34168 RepID=A0ACC2E9L2_DIPCM|nr:hypothetical protein O6H91_03G094100 [Diphasiastrum complanatum]
MLGRHKTMIKLLSTICFGIICVSLIALYHSGSLSMKIYTIQDTLLGTATVQGIKGDELQTQTTNIFEWANWPGRSPTNVGTHRSSNSAQRHEIDCQLPLKVYMYDLPRKFNLGFLQKGSNQDLPWVDEAIPMWPSRSSLVKQHNTEYWMMVSLLTSNNAVNNNLAAVRVDNPENAELFFVPFFSSLSFNVHGRNMLDPETIKDKNLQEDLLDLLQRSKWWHRSGGRDHVFPMHHPNAFRFHRDQLNSSIWIVADFWRNPKNVSWLSKDVVAPYTHMVPTYNENGVSDPFESRSTLLFFQGRIKRKDDGVIRSKLANLLKDHSKVHYVESSATDLGIQEATTGMRNSKFCLHPAGDTPSSCRLFDAIASNCIPVIISDFIELPFEDELNYKLFSLFFSLEEAVRPGYLLQYLEGVDKSQWMKMWTRLKEVKQHFEYQYPPEKDDAVDMIWKQLHHKLSNVKLTIHRTSRLKVPDWWR